MDCLPDSLRKLNTTDAGAELFSSAIVSRAVAGSAGREIICTP